MTTLYTVFALVLGLLFLQCAGRRTASLGIGQRGLDAIASVLDGLAARCRSVSGHSKPAAAADARGYGASATVGAGAKGVGSESCRKALRCPTAARPSAAQRVQPSSNRAAPGDANSLIDFLADSVLSHAAILPDVVPSLGPVEMAPVTGLNLTGVDSQIATRYAAYGL